MVSWGERWDMTFDLVIFIYLNKIGMKRLEGRDFKRYGDQLLSDPLLKENSKAFLIAASRYNDPNSNERSLKSQEHSMGNVDRPILKLDGYDSLFSKTDFIFEYLRNKI
jgi:hypothetical protein